MENIHTTNLFAPITEKIDAALLSRQHTLVAIDGMSGSGKSSLSALLGKKYGCPIIHADDFFLQDHQRTPERLAQPGGNIDYERLLPIVEFAAKSESFSYTPFSCQTGEFADDMFIPAHKLVIVEGVYSLHPNFSGLYDLNFFLETSPATQRRRILTRSGEALAKRFFGEWVPMENHYFDHFNIKQNCHAIINTDNL